jgi:phosphate starvation-inducible protein PhoH
MVTAKVISINQKDSNASLSFFILEGNMAKRQEKQDRQPQLTLSHNRLKIRLDDMDVISPLTENQKKFFELYKQGESFMMLHGVAGTGKTFIALYKALEEVLDKSNNLDRVVVVRSAVPSREIGHLPGDEKEKTEVYKEPYIQICSNLFGRSDAYQRLEEQGVTDFLITSFLRGITLDNCVVLVDECQNLTDAEINTIMTRVGVNTKIIFCGDFRQTDLCKKQDMSGLKKFIAIAKMMPTFRMVEFATEDIVRSDIVKQFILARLAYEDNNS